MVEFLSLFGEAVLVRLQESSVLWLSLLSTVASGHSSSLDYVPVFIDCTDIEVDKKCFEGAKLRYSVTQLTDALGVCEESDSEFAVKRRQLYRRMAGGRSGSERRFT